MGKHVAILGFVYGILGLLSVLGGLLVMLAGAGSGLAIWLSGDDGAGPAGGLVALLGGGLGVILAFGGLLNVLTAVGLLARRGWGRILGIIASVLNVISMSWMSLVGIYGLWVLLSQEGAREFSGGRR